MPKVSQLDQGAAGTCRRQAHTLLPHQLMAPSTEGSHRAHCLSEPCVWQQEATPQNPDSCPQASSSAHEIPALGSQPSASPISSGCPQSEETKEDCRNNPVVWLLRDISQMEVPRGEEDRAYVVYCSLKATSLPLPDVPSCLLQHQIHQPSLLAQEPAAG